MRLWLVLVVCGGCVGEDGGFITLRDDGSSMSVGALFERAPMRGTHSQVVCGTVGPAPLGDGGTPTSCVTITCTEEQIGPCRVIDCQSADGGMPMTGRIASDSAGTLSISVTGTVGVVGKTFTSPPVSVVPCSTPRFCRSASDCSGIGKQICQNGACQTCQSNSDCGSTGLCDSGQCVACAAGEVSYSGSGGFSLWSGGETLTVAASGGNVPGFSASLVAPANISFNGFSGYVIRSEDLDISWSGGDKNSLALGLNIDCTGDVARSIGSAGVSALCELPGGARKGTIPSAVLQKFPSGQSASYDACSRSRSTFSAGGWDVSVVALTPSGSGSVELQ